LVAGWPTGHERLDHLTLEARPPLLPGFAGGEIVGVDDGRAVERLRQACGEDALAGTARTVNGDQSWALRREGEDTSRKLRKGRDSGLAIHRHDAARPLGPEPESLREGGGGLAVTLHASRPNKPPGGPVSRTLTCPKMFPTVTIRPHARKI